MRPLRLQIHRIPPLRPLRPPSTPLILLRSRVFTSSAPSHLVSRAGPRPQLPFLASPFARRHALFSIRLLSTEQKAYIKYQLRLGAYWTVMGWVVLGGLAVCYFVLRQDWLGRLHPSPAEWHWQAKYAWRLGCHEEDEEQFGRGMTDWGAVGHAFRTVYILCEKGSVVRAWAKPLPQNADWAADAADVPGLDAADMAAEPVSPVLEVEKVGYDVAAKSEEWRRGYFHALMASAKTAEMDFGWVRDKKRHLLFPAEQMIGPSNPSPKPLWPGSPPAPKEEDCEIAYDPPNLWYGRILTTRGFSRDQRLTAALAFASWVDYNGDASTAGALYDWSLRLAATSQDTSKPVLVNPSTGVIPTTAPYTTPNILSASTALASHHARAGSLVPALNIYTSILRARRAASPVPANEQYPVKGPDLSLTSVDSWLRWLTSLPYRVSFPPPPPSGDLPYQRTAASACEDAALMGYVGEILFASANGQQQKRDALSWTRDAVAIAESGQADKKLDAKAKRVCTQCLGTGLENWHKMVGALAQAEDEATDKKQSASGMPVKSKGGKGWSWWAPLGGNKEDGDVVHGLVGEALGEWKKEEAMVAKRKADFAEAKLMEQLNRHISTKSSWFVV